MVNLPANGEAMVEAGVRELLAEACATVNVHTLQPGPTGYSSRLWLAETDEGPLLVRLPLRSRDPESLRGMLVATRLASEAGITTVRYRAFCPNTPLGPALIQEYRPGGRATEFLKRHPEELDRVASTVGLWTGMLHRIQRTLFGGILGVSTHATWAQQVKLRVADALKEIDAGVLPVKTEEILAAFERAIGELPKINRASLVHADLYFDNVLVHENKAACLLDFEHAY